MDKPEFLAHKILNHLVGIRSNFAFGLQVWALLTNRDTAQLLKVHRVVVKPDGIYAVPPGKTMRIAEGESFYSLELAGPKEEDFKHAAMEFAKMHLRTFTTEMFEKLKGYCISTGQMDLMRKQGWYQFARMVRNSLKHSQHWEFNKYDLSILPVTWCGKTIDTALAGTEMTWDFYDSFDALELWDEMYDFAKGLK